MTQIAETTDATSKPIIFLSVRPDGYVCVNFHNCKPADFIVNGKPTARPLFTSDEVDARAKSQFEAWKNAAK